MSLNPNDSWAAGISAWEEEYIQCVWGYLTGKGPVWTSYAWGEEGRATIAAGDWIYYGNLDYLNGPDPSFIDGPPGGAEEILPNLWVCPKTGRVYLKAYSSPGLSLNDVRRAIYAYRERHIEQWRR